MVSKAASLPEVCGDAGHYVDPLNVDSIAEGITEVLSDNELRQTLITKGIQRAQQFSWERTARDTLKVFNQVMHQ
ncbi:MAG: hypothetical protein HYV00_00705 [Deltaproteobacteria bacterium]|nr:hypothetical protein [Deltaproteobacteria bacterium]